MKITRLLVSPLAVCIIALLQPVFAQNTFTVKPKPEAQQMTTHPAAKSQFLAKIVLWQHQLRQKMAGLVREAKATESLKPLAFLLMFAFAYGVIHAAGPGHGKAFAISYILSQRPRLLRGILFGNFIALFHGLSGILFVLIIRIILQKSITGTLEDVTRISQIISFSLITCLGLGILIKSIYRWVKSEAPRPQGGASVAKPSGTTPKPPGFALRATPRSPHAIPPRASARGILAKASKKGSHPAFNESHKRHIYGPLLSALVVGMIPCPGVVMVMLFALSMNMVGLGIILGITISIGMALTLTCVVVTGISGKAISLGMVARNASLAITLEYLVETIAGLMVAGLGLLFLITII